ncbi:hypothetical protein GCM10010261_16920 [Streptomyces pilosus]|uniref:Uncharacterized protein n=1 Tax=Streptomyces pilosus TaxID=28893 RepID=A0A918BKG6_9ACTN|nr:hypothetical protein GCM10010280_22800 [Streptomyces pilosus]GGV43567.1 hypothetical protein GCM10010261_16920 [Streptomyces pilosus]
MSFGTRVQDFRPGDPDGARLLRSSLLINYSLMGTAYYLYCELLVASNSATLRQPVPSPVLRLLWLRTPLPNLPVRAPAAGAFTEVLLTDFAAGYCEPSLTDTAVLLVAAPDHCGPPGPVVSPVAVLDHSGFGTPPPHRHANCNCVLLPGSSSLPGLS